MTTTTETLSRDLIGSHVEFHHPVTGRLMVGDIVNVFKNGKVCIHPTHTRHYNTLTAFEFSPKTGYTAKWVNVKFSRCEPCDSPM
jgi:hypothetical protein